MTDEVIGREDELAAIEAFLARRHAGPAALVLEGEAGIGKSTLWAGGLAAARGRFATVLASRPAESERSLANVILGDLFADVSTEVIDALPVPRRDALRAALLLGDADQADVEPRALGAAVLRLLTVLAADGPVVLAIDDDQWIDASSAASLTFALRRLSHEPIRLLLARRTDDPSSQGPRLEETLGTSADSGSVEHIEVGALSIGALQLLLRQRLGVALSRPNLLRLADASGGNPFFALELARAQPAGSGPPGPLVVPPTLERLLAGRLEDLDGEERSALLVLAAHGRLPHDLLQRLDLHAGTVDRLAGEHLVEWSEGALRFTHSLLASTVYQRASPGARRATHLRLAAIIDDPIGRARHLALGTEEADAAIADALAAAADVARSRGMPIVAAELAEHATRLTPAGQADDALARRAMAARAHMAAGEATRALALVATQLKQSGRGPRRAETLVVRSSFEAPAPAVATLLEALREAAGTPRLQAAVHERLADVGRFMRGTAWAEQHIRAALRLAERSADEQLEVRARSVLAVLRFEAADPGALDLARGVQERATALADPEATRIAAWTLGHCLMWARRTTEARTWLEGVLAGAAAHDELLRADSLWYLAMVELWAGRWNAAWEAAEEAAEVHRQYGIEQPQDHMPQALIALFRGQLALARDHSRRAISLAAGMMLPVHLAVLGMADLWSGRPRDALATFESAEKIMVRRGVREPAMFMGRAEHVETLLQLGRASEAERLVAEWEAAATRSTHEWCMAEVIRSRGMMAVAGSELDHAAQLLGEAAERHRAAGDPFGRGRALLALGGVHRRQRRKRRARETLEVALGAFEVLGAAGFAAEARRELGRLGGRQRIEGLSPSEQRVAALVAQGHTNREVAARLFLGERTVASHLSHVYAKLGIRSRTELARRLPPPTTEDAPAGSNIPTS